VRSAGPPGGAARAAAPAAGLCAHQARGGRQRA
jgi:hypothetical protein